MLADLAVHCLAIGVSLVFGLAAYFGLDRLFDGQNKNNVTTKSKTNSIRFYECATYSKSQHIFRTGLSHIVFLIMFLIYDVDLLLITSEMLVIFGFGFFECVLFFIFIFFLVLGLMFDSKKIGFS